MKKTYRILFFMATVGSICLGATPLAAAKSTSDVPRAALAKIDNSAWVNKEANAIRSRNSTIDENVLRLSLTAYQNAQRKGLNPKRVLTVIDFSKPSTEKRLWVFDLPSGKTLFNTWVAHGQNSGYARSTSFSNTNGSLKSSLGVFMTDEPYYGGHGLSLRLRGLEYGYNDRLYSRAVVIHGANYVNADTIRNLGRLGRSWGCPAVNPSIVRPLVNTIKYNALIFAYYPDRSWLSHSSFLG